MRKLFILVLLATLVSLGCIQNENPTNTIPTPVKTPKTIVEKVLAKYTPLRHYVSKIVFSTPEGKKVVCTIKYNGGAYYVVCSNGMIVFSNESGTLVKEKTSESFSDKYVETPFEKILDYLKQNPNATTYFDKEKQLYVVEMPNFGGSSAKCYVKPDGTIVSLVGDNGNYVKFIEIDTSAVPKITPPPEFLKHLKGSTVEAPRTNETEVFFYYSPDCPHCHEVFPLVLNWTKYVKVHICNVENPADPACKVFINRVNAVPVAFVVRNGTVKEYLGTYEIKELNDLIINGKLR